MDKIRNLIKLGRKAILRAADEDFGPNTNFLPRKGSKWSLVATVATILATLACLQGWAGEDFIVLGFIGTSVIMAAAIPTAAFEAVRNSYGENPPLSTVIKYQLLALIPNVAVNAGMPFSNLAFTDLAELMTGSRSTSLYGALLAVGVTLFYILYMNNRYRIIEEIRAALNAEKARAKEQAESRQVAEARLQTLQAQIEPHFLYNTLANVQHLIGSRPGDAEEMLSSLIRYLRESLPKMRSGTSTLEQEFSLSRAYLDIARIRFGGRLSVLLDLPPELASASFPPLVIQTLLENALKHGAEPKVGPVSIAVQAAANNDIVTVRVEDTGAGFGDKQGTGFGLKNIRERLATLYPERSGLVLAPNAPSGVIATVTIPLERQ